ncbi:pancreas/duodenum homeobox protein 1 [Maridesulfovibrio ferrireducens]|uniref:pancreas/duodenum homeobox protein 1 n=1 Tax=Maridesulfovibrio ferrireducens TaxID=246191 RepID=UPI001A25A08F|nr:pancreas/duodenum homeobox protein 1 [Maridesulfovibrio ferrireducens]MBI9109605.1 pancreas/duodenum homeobox protein 1 [Maridesulfovibrio ferrireducens]
MGQYGDVFIDQLLESLFPASLSNDFFEALFGDAEEGSYDIELGYVGDSSDILNFELRLKERPGCCLACNLTYGLPQVFSRHPIINIQGLAEKIGEAVGKSENVSWKLGSTQEKNKQLHVIPLIVSLS